MNIFRVLLNAIKARFTGIVTKLRLFTRKDFWSSVVIARARQFFQKLFDVKPKDKDDYYTVFGWMISKRLAFAIVIIIGALSLFYIISTHASLFPGKSEEHIKTYSYNSPLLKLAKGEVRITGRHNYLAYEGSVEKGRCNGAGTLYNRAGNVVYQGGFADSMYEGQGVFYYDDGTTHYSGEFHENLFSGKGTLYRENGSQEYVGGFLLGMKEGEGTLFDTGKKAVFQGEFTQDDIKHSSLLGMSSQELGAAYTGRVVMYDNGDERVRCMKDVDVMSVETADEESVNEEYAVNQVYVLRDSFRFGGKDYQSLVDISGVLGQPTYEGVSRVTLAEAVAMNELKEGTAHFGRLPEMSLNQEYTEYAEVEDYDEDYEIYLTSFTKDGLIYHFVSGSSTGKDKFAFYYILREE